MAKVSVLIPTVARPTLQRTLKSLLAQSCEDWEALVVGDGVAEGQVEPMIEEIGSDDRIHYWRLPSPSGNVGATARNYGFQQASGEYIALLDDDDLYLPRKLELLAKVLDENPQVAFVYGKMALCDKDTGELFGAWWREHDPEVLRRAAYIPSPSHLFRRELLEAQLFDTETPRNTEWRFYVRCVNAGASFAGIKKAVAICFINPALVDFWAPGGLRKLSGVEKRQVKSLIS